tara:strand:+ start:219 stop:449 length:231 start_codon:yes stop_codon:yes gene_type:complete
MFQFAVAYFIMLLAMYFNGYIIICIFIGAWIGSFLFSWETVSFTLVSAPFQNLMVAKLILSSGEISTKEEATACCG